MTATASTEAVVRLVQLPDAADVAEEREANKTIKESSLAMMQFDGPNVFELWQHERRYMNGRFAGDALDEDAGDLSPWGSETGDWGYADRGMVNPKVGYAWCGAWLVDSRTGDEDGWQYAENFDGDEEESSVARAEWVSTQMFAEHNVRRRRWGRDQSNTRER
jgi:hypothetical protein